MLNGDYFEKITDFIRVEKTFFSSFLGVMGFLFFNQLSFFAFPIFISSFCVIAACRAFNNIFDKKEDKINRKKINPLTEKRDGLIIVVFLFLSGLILSFMVSEMSMYFYIIAAFSGMIYSPLRVKTFLLVKNIFSGVVLSFVFLIGAGFFNFEVILNSFMLFFFVFSVSIVSDLIDLKGDKKAGIKTVPAAIGPKNTRIVISTLLFLFSLITICMRLKNFYIFSVFSFLAIIFILTGKIRHVQKLVGFSTILTVIVLSSGFWI